MKLRCMVPVKSGIKNKMKKLQLRSAIIGVTGHTNERPPADYEEGDEREQRVFSSIISAGCAEAQSSRVSQPLEPKTLKD